MDIKRYILNLFCRMLSLVLLLLVLVACGQKQAASQQRPENREAKQLLQGVWTNTDTDDIIFKMQGDSVYFPDSTSQPAYFLVTGDSLFIGSAGYRVERQSEHTLWFVGPDGELLKLAKSTDEDTDDKVFEQAHPQILTLTEVLKRDTVVFCEGERYHLYVAVNPTRYKVVRHTINDDGLQVDNVYYDNTIHLSVFYGASKVFSRDMRKSDYAKLVPSQFLEQAILNDINFHRADAGGFHFYASLCIPDDATCYMVEHIVTRKGQLSSKLVDN